jgi:hypothetical protein
MMRSTRFLAALLVGLIWAGAAYAACGDGASNCFWVGGTGTLDVTTDTLHWAAVSNGASCNPCEPAAGDSWVMDANSGGGTITLAAGPFTNNIWNAGGYTNGTIDMSVNNPSVTTKFIQWTGSVTRTFKCGTGTIHLNATTGTILDNSTGTSETLTCTSVTISVDGTTTGTRTITIGTKTGWGIFNINYTGETRYGLTFTHGGNTIQGLTFNNAVTGTLSLTLSASNTLTVTNTINIVGNSGGLIGISSSVSGTNATMHLSGSSPTCNWANISDITVNTNTISCTNSFTSSNQNSGVTISGPVIVPTGGGIIGG